MESILETKASTILEVLSGLRGTLSDLRRGDLGRMVVRFAPAACGPVGGVRSAQERAAQTWQQK